MRRVVLVIAVVAVVERRVVGSVEETRRVGERNYGGCVGDGVLTPRACMIIYPN